MSRDRDLTFDEWINYAFDRPVAAAEEIQWYFKYSDDDDKKPLAGWLPRPATIAEYLARLLESPRFLLDRFDEEQIEQGIWFIFGCGSSADYWDDEADAPEDEDYFSANYPQRALHPAVPHELRERWVRAINVLYRDLYAPTCVDWFGLARDPGLPGDPEYVNALHGSCWMLWDLDDLYEDLTRRRQHFLVEPVFDVLRKTLTLPSAVCQAGALHALGHLQSKFPERVWATVNTFLATSGHLHPNVRRYAEDARYGHVQ